MSELQMELQQKEPGLWELNDGLCRSFLIEGREKALLWDTGMGAFDIRKEVRTLTDKPLEVVLSHGHWDHLGGLLQFGRVWLHPDDEELMCKSHRERHNGDPRGRVQLCFLTAGQVFDLGGKTLEIVPIPGHSEGSVALLNRAEGYALTGDTFQDRQIILFGENSDICHYQQTLRYFLALKKDIHRLYPSHCPMLEMDQLEKIEQVVQSYFAHPERAERSYLQIPGRATWINRYEQDGMELLLRADK